MDPERFVERLPQLCIGARMRGFPQGLDDLDVFLQSVASEIPREPVLSERWVNAAILRWLEDVGLHVEIDHVNIRRRLVDYGYLSRTRDGKRYALTDKVVDVPDSRAVIARALEERAARRAAAEAEGRTGSRSASGTTPGGA